MLSNNLFILKAVECELGCGRRAGAAPGACGSSEEPGAGAGTGGMQEQLPASPPAALLSWAVELLG